MDDQEETSKSDAISTAAWVGPCILALLALYWDWRLLAGVIAAAGVGGLIAGIFGVTPDTEDNRPPDAS
jgi:hypothetical protein